MWRCIGGQHPRSSLPFGNDWVRLIGVFITSITQRKIGDDPNRRNRSLVCAVSINTGCDSGRTARVRLTICSTQPNNVRTGLLVICCSDDVIMGGLLLAERMGKYVLDMPGYLTLNKAIGIGLALRLFNTRRIAVWQHNHGGPFLRFEEGSCHPLLMATP